MKDTQRITDFFTLHVWKEGKVINIRKKSKFLGVVELSEREAIKCYKLLEKILKIEAINQLKK